MKRVPKVGECLPFFDDGKYSPSRHYAATVTKVITIDEAKKLFFPLNDEENKNATISLYDIWRNEVDSHRNSPGFTCAAGGPGAPWLYAEDTDCFIECSIPNYDESPIYFARMINGGWFSMDVTNWWQSGRLDVDLETFENYQNDYPDEYWNYIGKYKPNE